MNNELIKRYSLVEIALFGVFALGLLLAYIVVHLRQRTIFSELIPLKSSGIAVSLPKGPGWESSGTWQYEVENSMMLIAEHQQQNQWDVQIRWRYVLASGPETPTQRLQKYAEMVDAASLEINQTSGPHPMEYACFYPKPERGPEVYLGIVTLDFGRSLELQVQSYRIGDGSGRDIFLALAGDFEYETPIELQRGIELLQSYVPVTSAGSDSDGLSAFLIQDVRSRNIGYYTLGRSPTGYQLQYFELKNHHIQSDVWLRQWPDEIIWKTSVSAAGLRGSQTFDVQPDTDGNLRVKSSTNKTAQIIRHHSLLPEVLTEDFAQTFLKSSSERVCIDTLAYDGRIIPVCLQTVPPEQAHARSNNTAAVVRLEYQIADDYFEELLFDAAGQLIGKYIQLPNGEIRLWDAATLEEVKTLFQDYYQQSTERFALMER